MIHLSFASGEFVAYQKLLSATALHAGCERSIALGPADIDAAYREQHREILGAKRGAGFWLWKPWAIAHTLERLGEGEYLLYTDAAMHFVGDVSLARSRLEASDQDLLVFGEWSAQGAYTRRDAFLLMDLDTPEMAAAPQRLASALLLRNSDRSRGFVAEWLRYCEDPRVLADRANALGEPDYPGFIAHRHDQSVFSLLSHREGVPCAGHELIVEGLQGPRGHLLNHTRRHSSPGEIANFLLREGILDFSTVSRLGD